MIRKAILISSFAITLFFLLNGISHSQDKWWKNKKYTNEEARIKHELCKKTFKDIGYGFLYNNINYISPYFESQVYLNVVSNDKGYYSSDQSGLILSDFMDYFKVESFGYYNSNKFNSYAFANGTYSYLSGSKKLDLAVTISLKYYNKKWFVDQITIK
jgi:hypothetical protein